ncbi:hypothetical protein PA12_gene17 [Pseudomonas aeruginosa]|nr:hypothetical protein PA12_gene17 [Pseudomonas aeruginosa]
MAKPKFHNRLMYVVVSYELNNIFVHLLDGVASLIFCSFMSILDFFLSAFLRSWHSMKYHLIQGIKKRLYVWLIVPTIGAGIMDINPKISDEL